MDSSENIITRVGSEPNEHLVIMLHGWSGDERSMWVFQEVFPPTSLIVSVRGMYPAVGGGYQWIAESPSIKVACSQFQPAIEYLREVVGEINLQGHPIEKLILVGFSQGAALSFAAMGDLKPDRIVSIAGFIHRDVIGRKRRTRFFGAMALKMNTYRLNELVQMCNSSMIRVLRSHSVKPMLGTS